jgi:peptidoglycan/LPS O-acetylase OafA/YrhL
MKYRREIDGLRALAVLPVILFHAGFSAFGGGYVGVDVFFVISGFLITSIIVSEQDKGSYSILKFYERRARRIMPALFAVLAVCVPAAWMVMLPDNFREFSKSLISVPAFASNFYFLRASDYFSTDSALKPLLHTWSLAVEEQYYVFFPLLLALIWPWGRKRVSLVLAVLLLLSLGLAQGTVAHHPGAAFFMLHTRCWELLIGAMLAIQMPPQGHLMGKSRVAEIGSLAGMALILGSIVVYTESTPFPSVYTLAPTLGTALILAFASPHNLCGRLLSTRPMVGIGLISYSAYLWHQPLLATAREALLAEPTPAILLGLVLATFVLAYLSWRFIETPFRDPKRVSRKQIFGLVMLISMVFVGIGFAGYRNALGTRWASAHPRLVNLMDDVPDAKSQACPGGLVQHGDMHCKRFGAGPTRIVVWGDSHADALSKVAPQLPDGVEVITLTHLGCPPIMGVRRFDGKITADNCDRTAILAGYAEQIRNWKPAVVFLVGRWSLYLHGLHRHGVAQDQHYFLSDDDQRNDVRPPAERLDMMARKMNDTIAFLSVSSRVVVVSQPPDYAWHDYLSLSHTDYQAPIADVTNWHQGESAFLERVKAQHLAQVLDLKPLFCDAQHCQTRKDGVLLYNDDNHLSRAGVPLLWQAMLEAAATSALRPAR